MPEWLKNRIKYTLKAVPAFWYDFIRFYKYSGFTGLTEKSRLEAMIIHDYHIIEKGLTMPETRLGFGKQVLLILISNCKKYIALHGYSNIQVKHAVQVVNEYKEFHNKLNYKLDETVIDAIDSLALTAKDNKSTTQRTISNTDYFSDVENAFPAFSASRSSVRNYSSKELDINRIIEAVSLARNTPSACNRQTSKVYVFTKREEIDTILKLQGGNRGFGHLTNKLIVVTADQSVFFGVNERYQTYVDGGMFAMNLLYTLHSEKILACILNCSHSPEKDKQMRKICPIKESEVFIAMITCGEAPDEFQVALSCRNSVEDYISIQ